MTQVEWAKILKIYSHDELTEEDKEELYYDLTIFEYDPSIPNEQSCTLLKIFQDILKFKGNQVESLLNEIDRLAASQGEEDAQRHQTLLDEIESLQDQLLKAQKFDNLSGSNFDDIRQELLQSELKNEHLLSELQARESDIVEEKKVVEKFANQVMVLERERGELRSELAALQRETLEQQEVRLQGGSPKLSEKHKEFVETIHHKNNHITQLLYDIEAVEKENNVLKIKLAGLQNESTDNKEQLKLISGENINYQHIAAELQERIALFEENNNALKNQVLEMAVDKQKRDDKLDQLGLALDARLAQWQELLVQKDTELIELKKKLTQMSAQFPNSFMNSTKNHLENMAQSLDQKEEQVEELQQQLAQANVKLAESQDLIKHLNEELESKTRKHEESPRLKKMKRELAEAHSRLLMLEAKVTDAENDAEVKAEEMTEMVIQLREYETGVFGMHEAMQQIKVLQKQKNVRDMHIEQLIQAGNLLQSDTNHLEEENLALRAQLGLDVDEIVRVNGVLAKYKADQQALSETTQKLQEAINTQLTLKVQNRMYKKTVSRLKLQLKKVGYEPEVISSEDDRTKPQPVVQGLSEEMKALLVREAEVLEDKLQDVIDENEALRKGMHEILDSVRSHDGASAVHIESACLERLLEALDSRHMSGWYHPAMRLQAQLNTVEGHNSALREQIRISRGGEQEAKENLNKALLELDILQAKIHRLSSVSQENEEQKPSTPTLEVPARAIQFVEILKSKTEVSKQDEQDKSSCNSPDEQLDNLKKQLINMETMMAEQKEIYESDKESWLNVRNGLQNEIDCLNEKVAVMTAEMNEYTENWSVLQGDPDQVKNALANATIKLASLSSEAEKQKRKYSVVQGMEMQMRGEMASVQEELLLSQSSMKQAIELLNVEKDKIETDYKLLQQTHSDCFSSSELDEAKEQLSELTIKYRELLASKTLLDTENNMLINKLQSEVDMLKKCIDLVPSSDNDNNQISVKHTATEVKEQHAERMYKLVKDQLKESEEHCKELERQLSSMVQQSLSQQLTEAELRNQLVDAVSHSTFLNVQNQLIDSEKLVGELKMELGRMQVSLGVAEDKAKTLEQQQHFHNYQHDALQRQVLELSATSEEKLTIGRLTRELLRVQESELNYTKELLNLKSTVEKLEKETRDHKDNFKNIQDKLFSEKKEYNLKYRWLVKIVHEQHLRYLGHLSLLSAETFQAMLSRAYFDKSDAWTTASDHTDSITAILKQQTEATTAEKLQALKYKFNIQSLEAQLSQTRSHLQRVNKMCSTLQDELLNQDKCWEKKQIVWEQLLLNSTLDHQKGQENIQEAALDHVNEEVNIEDNQDSPDATQKSLSPVHIVMKEEKETMTVHLSTTEPLVPGSSENTKQLNNQLSQMALVINEQTVKLGHCAAEIVELKSRLDILKQQLDEKEKQLTMKENDLMDLQKSLVDKNLDKIEEESTETLALKATIASLQNIVNQKEETIGRYQNLLQDCRQEYSKTVANLQQEMSNLQQAINNTSESKEKNKEDVEKSSSAMKVIVERYLARVHQLEDELAHSREQTTRLTTELSSSQQQTDKWTHTAEERLKTILEMKQRLDSARSKEDLSDSNSELIEKSTEIMEKNKIISNLKEKLESREIVSSSRERIKGELDRANKRMEVVQNQNTELKAEVQRLRKQLTIRQSSTPKSEVVTTAREEVLQKKIKMLEEKISEYENVIQRGKEIHKSKCNEEFEKWEEKKKWQANIEKLKVVIKEKSCQVEALRATVDRLKETIIRLEKEKISLEGRLRSIKAPCVSQNLVEELEKDRAKLQQELMAVRMKSAECSSLTSVIKNQERRMATLKIAQKGETAIADEVERLIEGKCRLQQTNLKLEAQNLELKMQLEKRRLTELTPRDSHDINSETESVGMSPKGKSKVGKNRADLERAVIVLKRVVEKLQAENKELHSARLSDVHEKDYVEKLQIELQTCQENYLDAVDKCSALEEELKRFNKQFSPCKRDDLVDELSLTKSQLAQKCQLLSKVKVLLENAVIREKALKEQVRDLEKLVPPERIRGTYHERRH